MRSNTALEKHIVSRIVYALEVRPGIIVRKRHGTAMGVAGDPDLYGSLNGRHFEIEVKRPDGPSQLVHNAHRIELQGESMRKRRGQKGGKENVG